MHNNISIEQYKKILISIADSIHDFCEKNNIVYYICGGTLLGAIRHQGFIPWDDDIDIIMPRKDYERFMLTYKNQNYVAVNHEIDKKFPYSFGKVYDKNTRVVEKISFDYEMGAYIDIFPVDFLSDNESSAIKLANKLNKYRNMNDIKLSVIDKNRPLYKNFILVLLKICIFPISNNFVLSRIQKFVNKNCNKKECLYWANIMSYMYHEKEVQPFEWYKERLLVNFEHRQYYASKSYDKILTKFFNNYMELPPINERNTHHGFEVYYK